MSLRASPPASSSIMCESDRACNPHVATLLVIASPRRHARSDRWPHGISRLSLLVRALTGHIISPSRRSETEGLRDGDGSV
ncbi:hypothetical protein RRG08_049088 [Elysia crispata]|uniref:Uncharacterized protein n=1 Tax=Elysia crispata TaxID=231223 RepID=A0AAE1A9S3_9GAST|nr:hypothetical protein RRG08_049088 [Elysia crispata]